MAFDNYEIYHQLGSDGDRSWWISEFEARLDYKVSSKTAKATTQSSGLNKPKKKKRKRRKEEKKKAN